MRRERAPAALAGELKGCVDRLQALYDLLTQRFLSFSLSGFNRNDQAAAHDVLAVIQSGDLVVRDLGCFVVETFQRIALAGAFFLSRLRLDTGLFDPQTQRPLSLLRVRAEVRCSVFSVRCWMFGKTSNIELPTSNFQPMFSLT